MMQLKRVYEPHAAADAGRFLVERPSPRGIARAALEMDAWLKDAAPSTELRRGFNHDSERQAEFKHRYRSELTAHRRAWAPVLQSARCGRVTLHYGAHDAAHNSTVAFRDSLNAKLRIGASVSAAGRRPHQR